MEDEEEEEEEVDVVQEVDAAESARKVGARKKLAADLEAGLGLASPLEFADDVTVDGVYSASSKGETDKLEEAVRDEDQDSVWDDEVIGGRGAPTIGSVYAQNVATKRVFVTVELREEEAKQVGALVASLRSSFPLDNKQLDSVVRWVQPDVMHITLHTLEVAVPRLEEMQVYVYICVP